MKVFSGSSNKPLVAEICCQLGITLGDIYLKTFPSGEKYCQFHENIRGEHVFLVQSTSNPANDNLMELLIMCDAAKRASAEKITVVIPYFGYSRQERKDKPRVPISAKLVMDMIHCAGATRVVTFDLHSPAVQGFFDGPVDQLDFKPALILAIKNDNIQCVVAADIGGVKRATEYAERLKVDLAIISKKRKGDSDVEIQQFIGDVNGKNVLIVDDLTESCGTIVQAAEECKNHGAKDVICAVTHGCFTDVGFDRLLGSSYFQHPAGAMTNGIIKKFYISNSVKQPEHWCNPDGGYSPYQIKLSEHITIVDMAAWFAQAISNIANNKSVTELFK